MQQGGAAHARVISSEDWLREGKQHWAMHEAAARSHTIGMVAVS